MLTKAKDVESVEFPWGHLAWLVSGELGNSEAMTFGRVKIKSGQANPRHMHPNSEEILYLLSGELEHSLGEKVFRMSPGDVISIPIGVFHNARSVDSDDAEMLVAFSTPDRQMVLEEAKP